MRKYRVFVENTEKSLLSRILTFSAIDSTHSSLTAPYVLIIDSGTFNTELLISFE